MVVDIKKIVLSIAMCFTLAIGALTLTACGTPELSRIVMYTMPRTTYYLGEYATLDGGQIEAKFSDNSRKIVNLNDSMFSRAGIDVNTVGTYPITITYSKNGKSATTTLDLIYKQKIALVEVEISSTEVVVGFLSTFDTLSANITPADATAAYQWQEFSTSANTWVNIIGATASTLSLDQTYTGKKLRVMATGTEGYFGYVTSNETATTKQVVSQPHAPIISQSNLPTAVTITLAPVFGVEYAISWYGGVGDPNETAIEPEYYVWQTSNVFTSLNPNTRYKFVARTIIAENEIHGLNSNESNVIRTVEQFAITDAEITDEAGSPPESLVWGDIIKVTTSPAPAIDYCTITWEWCDTIDGTYEAIPNETGISLVFTQESDLQGKFVRAVIVGIDQYLGTITTPPVLL